jgi:hypothetical protein
MGRYRNPKEVRVVVNYAEAAEWYGFPLPFEPIYPRNRKPGQKYLPRFISWPDDEPGAEPTQTFEEQQAEFMALILHGLSWGRSARIEDPRSSRRGSVGTAISWRRQERRRQEQVALNFLQFFDVFR